MDTKSDKYNIKITIGHTFYVLFCLVPTGQKKWFYKKIMKLKY